MKQQKTWFWLATGWLLLMALHAAANNIAVSNVMFWSLSTTASNVYVSFDLSWNNSWRMTDNWDAAWVFVKFKPNGSNEWFHATLSTNSSDHRPAANSEIAAGSRTARACLCTPPRIVPAALIMRAPGSAGITGRTATVL